MFSTHSFRFVVFVVSAYSIFSLMRYPDTDLVLNNPMKLEGWMPPSNETYYFDFEHVSKEIAKIVNNNLYKIISKI